MTANFNIQKQLPAQMLVELGYQGTVGRKLASPAALTLNQVRPAGQCTVPPALPAVHRRHVGIAGIQ